MGTNVKKNHKHTSLKVPMVHYNVRSPAFPQLTFYNTQLIFCLQVKALNQSKRQCRPRQCPPSCPAMQSLKKMPPLMPHPIPQLKSKKASGCISQIILSGCYPIPSNVWLSDHGRVWGPHPPTFWPITSHRVMQTGCNWVG